MTAGVSFAEADIIKICDAALKQEFINKNIFILSAAQLLNLMVGSPQFSRIRITPEIPDQARYVVYLEKPGFGHFVLNDRGKIWDSLNPNRPGAADYTPVSYREIT